MKEFKKYIKENTETLPFYSKELNISIKKDETNNFIFNFFSQNNTKTDRIIHFYKPISKTINFNEL